MASKRTASEAGISGSGPPTKLSALPPVRITVSTLEEMDMQVLKFQNKKLQERIEQRRKAEEELRKRIEQLEQRQTTDDAVLCIVNRYWNQLDEDARVLLQRFDAEGADESEKKNESPAVTSFLALLSQWDKPEIEEKLRQRVEFSKRAIGKLLQAYDRLLQRNERLTSAVREKVNDEKDTDGNKENENKSDVDIDIKKEPADPDTKPPKVEDEKTDGEEEKDEKVKIEVEVKQEPTVEVKKEPEEKTENDSEQEKKEEKPEIKLSEAVLLELEETKEENRRLHNLSTELHQRHHEVTLKNSELLDRLAAAETEAAELKNNVDDLEYNLENAKLKVDRLERQLSEVYAKVQTYEEGNLKVEGGGVGVSKRKFDEIYAELEEQRELATNRITELEKLQKDHQEALRDVERLKMDLSTLPEHVIVDTVEYKCLQSQFSVLYNESMQMKTQLEDARSMLQTSKNTHLRQVEQMESDELSCQKKLRTEMIQLEDQLAQVRREYDMLRIEFEQTLAANEQTGPINREMRNLITSLKNHNEQLKGEVSRYKRKLREAQTEINKLKSEQQAVEAKSTPGSTVEKEEPVAARLEEPLVLRKEEEDKEEKEREKGKSDAEIIKDLKTQLKKSQDSQKEMKLLLDMYKSCTKESRDKVQLMAAEKKARQEIEELRGHIRKMQEAERRERRKLAEEDAIRKIKKHEETIAELQKNLAAQKQEEEALLNEMEVTGQAFEDMQEQNIRLLQQLREKDDANFKLMSERIKSNQIHKLLREEKDVLAEQVATLQSQVEAQNLVVRKLEDKERILQNNLATIEKELNLRQQAMELHKRKAVETAQTAADLKLHLDKYHAQLKEAQIAVADKTSALQHETFKHKRILEEVASLRRKVERAKKIEMASSADEVLMEEIREYKEQLTCPSCKVKKKDAVLTKCFHVFCLECLKTRYETRQRKCPKCNAAFGANDYHRLYLT